MDHFNDFVSFVEREHLVDPEACCCIGEDTVLEGTDWVDINLEDIDLVGIVLGGIGLVGFDNLRENVLVITCLDCKLGQEASLGFTCCFEDLLDEFHYLLLVTFKVL